MIPQALHGFPSRWRFDPSLRPMPALLAAMIDPIRHVLPPRRVWSALLVGGLLVALAAPIAEAQGRIEQAPDSLRRDSMAAPTSADSMQQRLDAAADAVMTALDSLAAQSADSAQTGDGASPDPARSTITIDGLVINETRTKIGNDFFDVYYSRWDPPENARNFTITIKEQPMPSLGTRVVVDLNGEPVFQARLQPRYEYIEQAALQAIRMTWRRLQHGQSRRQIY